jgi:gas vesicle protein
MEKKKAWLVVAEEKKTENSMYAGLFNKIREDNEAIKSQSQAVSNSFENFDKLFGNLRDIKRIMNSMKESSGQTDGDNPEVNRILKDMGFVSVISKEEAGKDYCR